MEEAANLEIRKDLVAKKPSELDPEWFFQQFKPLLNAAVQASGLGTDRTTAADTLSVWLQRAVQATNQKLEWSSKLGEVISAQDADTIFSFVCDFWTDSGAALGNALRELFTKTIALLSMVRNYEYLEILKKWTVTVLGFPKTMRALYFMVEILMRHVGGRFVLENDPTFISDVLPFMESNALANPIGKALVTMNMQLWKEEKDMEEWTVLWVPATLQTLQDPLARNHIQVYFLTPLFKSFPEAFPTFVGLLSAETDQDDDEQMEILVGCLKIGQDLAILEVESVLGAEVLDGLLRHPSTNLRVGGLSLLVSSPKGSKPVPTSVFDMVKQYMDSLITESEPGFRHKVYGFLRQFVFRVRGYAYATSRAAAKLAPRVESDADRERLASLDKSLAECCDFCGWFLDYLTDLIRPGCPYHSVSAGTQLLLLLAQSGLDESVDSKFYEKGHIPFPFSIRIFSPVTVRLLVDNITNNYEDIRVMSSKILFMATPPLPYLDDLSILEEKALALISGMRAREGDGGAHIVQLLYSLHSDSFGYLLRLVAKLEDEVQIAKQNLAAAVMSHNIHGFYLSLRLIFEIVDYTNTRIDKDITERIVKTIFEIWEVVKPILCHDSPEGNLPSELEAVYDPELEAQYGPATQVILSYSWRAVKESMSLLMVLLDRAPQSVFSDDLVVESGEVILAQLSYVRHRGAFSSVYPTFISCCRRCHRIPNLKQQPKTWLTDNISLIRTHAQYITRRSGGLPYLITAVLTAEPEPTRQELVTETFDKLHAIAQLPAEPSKEDKVELPQVHAFNCIKTLFIESELSSYSAALVDRSLELAITSFSNEVWAIRNCAVMLYSALQARVFPVKTENRISARVFFTKFKNVRSMLLNYVQFLKGTSKSVETVYPVLALLARLEGVNGYTGLDEFMPLVMECLHSKVWKIRELAARTLGSMIPREQALDFGMRLLSEASITNQNYLHGVCFALVELRRVMEPNPKFVGLLESRFSELYFENPSPDTRLAFFRVLIGYCDPDSAGLKTIFGQLSEKTPVTALRSSERMLRNDIVEYYLDYVVGQKDKLDIADVLNFVFDSSYEVQLTAIGFLDRQYKKLDSTDSEKLCDSLWKLFKESDWDIIRGPAIRLFSKVFVVQDAQVEEYWLALFNSIREDSTEEITEAALQSLGVLTAQLGDTNRYTQWKERLMELSDETSPTSTRAAALESIISFLEVRADLDSSAIELRLCEFLSDDDPDIRERAAEFASEYLAISKATCVYAEKKLVEIMLHRSRTPLMPFIDSLLTRQSFDEQLNQSLRVDSLLFTLEKQNLFRNELAWIDLIAERLGAISPSEEIIEHVEKWALTGLKYFESALPGLSTDGILGYCANPDVFATIYRLRVVSRLLTAWERKIDTTSLKQLEESLCIHEKCRI